VYDSSWHSSMYAFMQDVWRAVLQQPPGAAAAAGAGGSSSSSSSAAACWCIEALYSPRQYIWGSTVLAVVDALAEDDVGLAVQAVQLLPDELLEQVVLPAAELLDNEVHAALQQELKRKKIRAGGSAAAVAAAQVLIGPAPWATKQQRDSESLGMAQGSSSGSGAAAVQGSVPSLATSAAAAAAAVEGDAARPVAAAGHVVSLLQELQQLQGLYPGVDLAALAHVAELHGLWRA
jgi:hypothetical protein